MFMSRNVYKFQCKIYDVSHETGFWPYFKLIDIIFIKISTFVLRSADRN